MSWEEPEGIYEENDLLNRVRSNQPAFDDVYDKANAVNYLRMRGHDI